MADERTGRLLRIGRTSTGRLRVDVEVELLDTEEEHEHGRPSPRAAKTGHTYASLGHEDDTRRDRFAKQTAEWLESQTERLAIDHVAVFAPPRWLGALREAWSPQLAPHVEEHQGDLTNLAADDLVRHDAIIALAPRPAASFETT
ncbi:MAG: baeRF12 domain-containing protein [Planctomycetota bacterium]